MSHHLTNPGEEALDLRVDAWLPRFAAIPVGAEAPADDAHNSWFPAVGENQGTAAIALAHFFPVGSGADNIRHDAQPVLFRAAIQIGCLQVDRAIENRRGKPVCRLRLAPARGGYRRSGRQVQADMQGNGANFPLVS